MGIEKLVVGQLQTNCYLAYDQQTKAAVIIDPGDDADFIIRKIKDLDLKPRFILATHGHFDHILGVTELRLAFKIPFLMAEACYLSRAKADPLWPPDKKLKNSDLIKFGKEKLKVIETPGHTPGSVCFYQKGILFSGDSLNLPNFTEKVRIYPGHGDEFF